MGKGSKSKKRPSAKAPKRRKAKAALPSAKAGAHGPGSRSHRAAVAHVGQPHSVSDAIELELARAGLGKRQRGEKLTAREIAAIKRVETEREKALRKEYYKSIPRSDWEEMSGRRGHVLNEQARRHGIPIGGETINLREVVLWLHEFLAEYGQAIAYDRRKKAAGQKSAAGESAAEADRRFKVAKADLEEIKLQQTRGEVIDVAEAARKRIALARWAVAVFERAGPELATRIVGKKVAQVQRIVTDYFDQVRREVTGE